MVYNHSRKLMLTGAILLVVGLLSSCATLKGSAQHIYPTNPTEKVGTHESEVYYDLVNGKTNIDWRELDGTLEFIENEYDCSDFRLVNLIRIIYEFEDSIPKDYKHRIEHVLFNFRYWIDEPGENSMCYWSENHQILFASAEFLIGQKYPTTIFPNSGLTGTQHMEKAKMRIQDWLLMRWNYGFTEFYSNVYYKEDIGALINLIDYSESEEIKVKSQIILDLLFYDVATQSCKNMFISVSGRAYARNRKGGKTSNLNGLTHYYWNNGPPIDAGMMYGLMVTKNYQMPPVLKLIANDTSNITIKQSNGLNIKDLKKEGYYGKDMRSLMMQWGMEAFINPKIVRLSLKHIRNYNLLSNEFLKDFSKMDKAMVRLLHLEPIAMRIIKPQITGTAIQKGNTYTYKTNDYSMYTVQNHQVGEYADQHHVFGMNISHHFSIFHTHPAVEADEKSASPNYWVGYGHLPHSVQHQNVNLSIYKLPNQQKSMEKDLLHYTHAYFPTAMFDTTVLVGNYIFGKKDDTYCVMIGAHPLQFKNNSKEDIIQKGKKVFWITEASSKREDGSFEQFIARIKNNTIDFNPTNLKLHYESNNTTYDLKYDNDFKINTKKMDTEYKRYDSPYIQAIRKDKTLNFNKSNQSLKLDFENLVRTF